MTYFRRRLVRLVSAAVLAIGVYTLVAASTATAAEEWTVGEISAPGVTRVEPRAVNENDVVVGMARFPGRDFDTPFRWEDGEMIELELPSGMKQIAIIHLWITDVNDAGTVVGYYVVDSDYQRTQAVYWTTTKTSSAVHKLPYDFQQSDPPPADENGHSGGSAASGINNDGTMVGAVSKQYEREDTSKYFLTVPAVASWNQIALGSAGDPFSQQGGAIDINENGAVMGSSANDGAFLSAGGPPTYVDLEPGRQGFNDLNHIVGSIPVNPPLSSTDVQAVLWDGDSIEPVVSSSTISSAVAVNNADWMVGRINTHPHNYVTSGLAVLWRPSAPEARLDTLVQGWSIMNWAGDINDDGMIVGVGRKDGERQAFWMAPAALAYKLTGKVIGDDGPIAGVTLKAYDPGDQFVDETTTDDDGSYEFTLAPGGYKVVAQPEGRYIPGQGGDCQISGYVCQVNLNRNRTADFYDTTIPDPACSDGQDNDGDRKIDFPADPGCEGPDDQTEAPDPPTDDDLVNNGKLDGKIKVGRKQSGFKPKADVLCETACKVTITGKYEIKRSKKKKVTAKGKKTSFQITEPGKASGRLKPKNSKAKKSVKKAIKQRKSVKAKLTIRVSEQAGSDRGKVNKTVKLKK